jgi:transcriptional regulator with XRE-family HTH domain
MSQPVKSLRQDFIDNKDDKSYRHAYADESLNITIATQIKVLREQHVLKQAELAKNANMKQSMISRYENVNYSSWSLTTLKRLAEAFDVILDVRFRSFKDLVVDTCNFSRESLQVPEFTEDPFFKETREEAVSVSVGVGVGAETALNLEFSATGTSPAKEESATSIAMNANPAPRELLGIGVGMTTSQTYQ